MEIKLIRNEDDYQDALRQIKALWNAKPDTPDGDRLETLSMLVHKYEEEHYPIDEPDPVDYIKVRMEELGLRHEDLVPYIGSRESVTEVLDGKRPLSLEMIRSLHYGLGFSLKALIAAPSGPGLNTEPQPQPLKLEDPIAIKGIEVFEDEDAFQRWLNTRNTALGKEKPIDWLDTPEKKKQVLNVLVCIEHGMYS
ncbi:antitoxin Xre/MbcA/ParS toxin-binding domain-containing protein [uncultured Pontibacter sp.]|uniref:antitoxin Xre/MbcA/ParS toxin-binding domain-containing protein n=1 Tax=uncultured Pontibacter sp. TaxID=453356 RepID=UPI0026210AFF|nr:antitoxin Xre/MbcA/ParS toxin-binding domain-containing protein [uncultured Pontibacter sp.]